MDKDVAPLTNYNQYQYGTVMIGQKYRPFTGFRDCGAGTNYFHKSYTPPNTHSSALGELNGFWKLGTPEEIISRDLVVNSRTFKVNTIPGHSEHPKQFGIKVDYSYSISNTLTSNSCEPLYTWGLPGTNSDSQTSYLKWDDEDKLKDFFNSFRGGYPLGYCPQAYLVLHVKQEGDICSR